MEKSLLKEVIRNYYLLTKFHVNVVVALTSVLGYLLGAGYYDIAVELEKVTGLFFGGILVTATAHIINQLLERQYDAMMLRTRNRPLVTGDVGAGQAVGSALLFSLSGLAWLYVAVHPYAAFISFVSLVMYAFIYTPVKRLSRIAVPLGAVPGALPVLIGYVGATGRVDTVVILLFVLQVIWQFPHFWSVAWIWQKSYEAAGYDLMPSPGGKTKRNAFLTFLSTFGLYPVIYLLYDGQYIDLTLFLLLAVLTLIFSVQAFVLFLRRTDISAKRLLKASVIYLPVVQLLIVYHFINR